LLAAFHATDSVLEKDDRIVHQKSDRQRKRHQRQIVEAVAERAHRDKSNEQRQRQSDGRD
jgi:hypothetical protein